MSKQTITKQDIGERLETIIDPEIGIDIYTLGLIYDITIHNQSRVTIQMTYTSPMCPAGPQLQQQIRDELTDLGFREIDIDLTFTPPWQMPDALRTMMGL